MDRLFRVRIDLALLQSHLSQEDRHGVSLEEVHKLLLDCGFARKGDWWTVEEKNLGILDPAEVLEAEVIGEEGAPDSTS